MHFSAPGLIIGLAVLAPNLLMVVFPPRDSIPPDLVPRWLVGFERIGQALCLVVPAFTGGGESSPWWTVPVAACLVGYYLLWLRYLREGRSLDALYRSVWKLPVPMAVLPVLVFLSAAGWLDNPWVAASAVILALGHIPAATRTARAVLRP